MQRGFFDRSDGYLLVLQALASGTGVLVSWRLLRYFKQQDPDGRQLALFGLLLSLGMIFIFRPIYPAAWSNGDLNLIEDALTAVCAFLIVAVTYLRLPPQNRGHASEDVGTEQYPKAERLNGRLSLYLCSLAGVGTVFIGLSFWFVSTAINQENAAALKIWQRRVAEYQTGIPDTDRAIAKAGTAYGKLMEAGPPIFYVHWWRFAGYEILLLIICVGCFQVLSLPDELGSSALASENNR
jgi:hypothetical protein